MFSNSIFEKNLEYLTQDKNHLVIQIYHSNLSVFLYFFNRTCNKEISFEEEHVFLKL